MKHFDYLQPATVPEAIAAAAARQTKGNLVRHHRKGYHSLAS